MELKPLFEDTRFQWGFRGDPYLWDELSERFAEFEFHGSTHELKDLLEDTIEQLAGESIVEGDHITREKYAHGGMSSGMISKVFWRETGIPTLMLRHETGDLTARLPREK